MRASSERPRARHPTELATPVRWDVTVTGGAPVGSIVLASVGRGAVRLGAARLAIWRCRWLELSLASQLSW